MWGDTWFPGEQGPGEERGVDGARVLKARVRHLASTRAGTCACGPVTWEAEGGDLLSTGIQGQHGKSDEALTKETQELL